MKPSYTPQNLQKIKNDGVCNFGYNKQPQLWLIMNINVAKKKLHIYSRTTLLFKTVREKRTETNHEAKSESANDRVNERDSRELEVTKMANEDVGDGVDAELTPNVENYRHCYLPYFHRFYPEHPPRLLPPLHLLVVAVLRRRRRAVQQGSTIHIVNHRTRVWQCLPVVE